MPKTIRTHWFAFGITFLLTSVLLYCRPALAQGRLAIIIDDIGYNLKLGNRTADLAGDFTLAVLPFTPYGIALAERAHSRGKEIMLHAPMSNHHNYPLGRGALVSEMQRAEFLAVLRQNLANIPHVKGVNNHMGSQLTEQAKPMGWLMHELKRRQLYFIDSRTTPMTVALITAQRIQLPSRRRDVFLDDERAPANIRYQLLRAVKLAQRRGVAIAIGHPYPETLAELEHIKPLLNQYRVQLVKVSQLLSANSRRQQSRGDSDAACIAPPINFWPQLWVPTDPFSLELVFKP